MSLGGKVAGNKNNFMLATLKLIYPGCECDCHYFKKEEPQKT